MGMSPRDVDACSLWEFLACRDGWIAANSPADTTPPPTAAEHDAMLAKWG